MILGVLLMVAAPMTTRAADKAVQQVAAPDTEPDALMCETVDRPGSRMKQRICAPSAEWSAALLRLSLLRNSVAAAVGPTGGANEANINTADTGFGRN